MPQLKKTKNSHLKPLVLPNLEDAGPFSLQKMSILRLSYATEQALLFSRPHADGYSEVIFI